MLHSLEIMESSAFIRLQDYKESNGEWIQFPQLEQIGSIITFIGEYFCFLVGKAEPHLLSASESCDSKFNWKLDLSQGVNLSITIHFETKAIYAWPFLSKEDPMGTLLLFPKVELNLRRTAKGIIGYLTIPDDTKAERILAYNPTVLLIHRMMWKKKVELIPIKVSSQKYFFEEDKFSIDPIEYRPFPAGKDWSNHAYEVMAEARKLKTMMNSYRLSQPVCRRSYATSDLVRWARSSLPFDNRIIGSLKKPTMTTREDDRKYAHKLHPERNLIKKFPLGKV